VRSAGDNTPSSRTGWGGGRGSGQGTPVVGCTGSAVSSPRTELVFRGSFSGVAWLVLADYAADEHDCAILVCNVRHRASLLFPLSSAIP
jgi:hypothetical protein